MQNGQPNRFALVPKEVMDGLSVNSLVVNASLPNLFDPKKTNVSYTLDGAGNPASPGVPATTSGSVNGNFEIDYSEIKDLTIAEVPAYILSKTLAKTGTSLAPAE